MNKKIWLSALLMLSACGCSSMNNSEKGMLGGAAVGTGIGALAGRGHPGAMLVGGALGTVVGGVAGANQDAREDRKNAQAIAVANAQAQAQRQMGLNEIVQLSQRGTPDDIIIQQIQTTGSIFRLTTEDITYLQEQRVSSRVISVMQTPPYRTVVVPRREVIYVAPPPPPPPEIGVGVIYRR